MLGALGLAHSVRVRTSPSSVRAADSNRIHRIRSAKMRVVCVCEDEYCVLGTYHVCILEPDNLCIA